MLNDHTTCHAQLLDDWREEIAREGEKRTCEERISKKNWLELNSCWLDARVNVSSLRQVLALLLHNIFYREICNDYARHETVGPGAEGINHVEI